MGRKMRLRRLCALDRIQLSPAAGAAPTAEHPPPARAGRSTRPRRNLARTYLQIAVLPALATACLGSETLFSSPPPPRKPEAVKRIAVPAFAAAAPLRGTLPEETAELLGVALSELLAARGIDVVPPSELTLAPPWAEDPTARRRLARWVHEEFGADTLAVGRVERFRERSGEALASSQPASIAFEIALLRAPGGQIMWRHRFDETQKALSEDILRATRYPGRGTRWLRALEYSRWALSELLHDAPITP